MSDPLDVLVLNALMNQLSSPSLGLPIAAPSITYTPTANVKYLDARNILRAQPDHPGLAFGSSTVNRGIFQVDVVGPSGVGEIALLRIAALLQSRFPIGLVLPIVPYKLQFQKLPVIAPAITDASWVRFPVSIPYLVIT